MNIEKYAGEKQLPDMNDNSSTYILVKSKQLYIPAEFNGVDI
jgi:hypothetical protein